MTLLSDEERAAVVLAMGSAIRKLATEIQHQAPDASGDADPVWYGDDFAKAALTAALPIIERAHRAQGWKPIETAPTERDKQDRLQEVLLIGRYPDTGWHTDVRHSWWEWGDHDRTYGRWARWPHQFAPTHWQPLPEPPALADEVAR